VDGAILEIVFKFLAVGLWTTAVLLALWLAATGRPIWRLPRFAWSPGWRFRVFGLVYLPVAGFFAYQLLTTPAGQFPPGAFGTIVAFGLVVFSVLFQRRLNRS
jgi:hypothetical protein